MYSKHFDLKCYIQHNNTQCAVMLSVIHAECHYAECRKQDLFAECHYAECRYVECRGSKEQALPLLANIRLGLEGLSGTNTLAYYERLFQILGQNNLQENH